ncbi:3'-5' exonuclease [Streptomyces sp. OfavH-34-F]|uniref:3'-5' exonuclease n=1 Tax=Streptomyces sp. OfavH-34-F TaxID=2917760 RepID=UPI001EF1FF21|nr:3'-5' exonuclease [Streptomyces sp. OfavH-34-F]MCG7523998.1 3'-5' exonuclease [Streptomyces sp. OfavH-34-F]
MGLPARHAAACLTAALGSGTPVLPDDVARLADEGLLGHAGEVCDHPLYDAAVCREPGPELVGRLWAVVHERTVWTANSWTAQEAAKRCELTVSEFTAAAGDAGLRPGRLGRWERTAVEAFAARTAPTVRASRTLGPEQSARRLGVRRRELDYLVEAGVLVPAGRNAKGTVQFTLASLDSAAAQPLDWHRAATAPPRHPSPWAELAGPLQARAELVRALVEQLREVGVSAWARYSRTADCWTVDWAPLPQGGPDREEVVAVLPVRLARAVDARRLVLLGPVGETMHWAQAMTQPGVACVIDCESTGLRGDTRVVEVAAVDAFDGRTLFESLVQPGIAIPAPATAIHKITDAMVAGSPTWDQVAPDLVAAVGSRIPLAYNSAFDAGLIAHHTRMTAADAGHLASPASWQCLMKRRSTWLSTTGWRRLGADHRALGDAVAALDVLRSLAQPPPGATESAVDADPSTADWGAAAHGGAPHR